MELALGQKGPIVPPPQLDQPYQSAALAIAEWNEVISATHWHFYRNTEADGIDFYVCESELGHIHIDGWVHLATNHWLCKSLIHRNLAQTFPYTGYEHWVRYRITGKHSARHATWLFRLSYLRLQGCTEDNLLSEINHHPASTPKSTGVQS